MHQRHGYRWAEVMVIRSVREARRIQSMLGAFRENKKNLPILLTWTSLATKSVSGLTQGLPRLLLVRELAVRWEKAIQEFSPP